MVNSETHGIRLSNASLFLVMCFEAQKSRYHDSRGALNSFVMQARPRVKSSRSLLLSSFSRIDAAF